MNIRDAMNVCRLWRLAVVDVLFATNTSKVKCQANGEFLTRRVQWFGRGYDAKRAVEEDKEKELYTARDRFHSLYDLPLRIPRRKQNKILDRGMKQAAGRDFLVEAKELVKAEDISNVVLDSRCCEKDDNSSIQQERLMPQLHNTGLIQG